MNSKKQKITILIGGGIIIILSILLMFTIREKQLYVEMYDSVQLREDSLENKIQEIEDIRCMCNYIFITGDTSVYKESLNYNYGYNLPCSIYIADHFEYPTACYNVYSEIVYQISNLPDTSFKVKEKAIELAINYLKKGAMQKDRQCAGILAGIYIKGDHVLQDTILGRKYLEQTLDNPELLDNIYNKIKGADYSCFFLDKSK